MIDRFQRIFLRVKTIIRIKTIVVENCSLFFFFLIFQITSTRRVKINVKFPYYVSNSRKHLTTVKKEWCFETSFEMLVTSIGWH